MRGQVTLNAKQDPSVPEVIGHCPVSRYEVSFEAASELKGKGYDVEHVTDIFGYDRFGGENSVSERIERPTIGDPQDYHGLEFVAGSGGYIARRSKGGFKEGSIYGYKFVSVKGGQETLIEHYVYVWASNEGGTEVFSTFLPGGVTNLGERLARCDDYTSSLEVNSGTNVRVNLWELLDDGSPEWELLDKHFMTLVVNKQQKQK